MTSARKKFRALPIEEKLRTLLRLMGYSGFREKQEEIVMHVIRGDSCLVIMPTGGGKSLCYQMPSCVEDGVGIVVSPLIALMQDQVTALKAKGIPCAHLSSSNTKSQNDEILVDLRKTRPKLKVLYITPESISSSTFKNALRTMHSHKTIRLFAIDEAHCISSWGHDFRPAYRELSWFRQEFPDVPCMALTATATKAVQEDIRAQLGLKQSRLFVLGFNRPNIAYHVQYKDILTDPFRDLMQRLRSLTADGSAIIYVHKRSCAEDMAIDLKKENFSAASYHGGMKAPARKAIQKQWMQGKLQIIISTVAFGMGIDKANVRIVAHWDLPKSLESYYQESGRGGRDGNPSLSILYYSRRDVSKFNYIIDMDLTRTPESKKRAANALKLVEKYAEARGCRRKILLQHFGDEDSPSCNESCDFCQDPHGVALAISKLDTQNMLQALEVKPQQLVPDFMDELLNDGSFSEDDNDSDESEAENGAAEDKVSMLGSSEKSPPKTKRQVLHRLELLEQQEEESNAHQPRERTRKGIGEAKSSGFSVNAGKPQQFTLNARLPASSASTRFNLQPIVGLSTEVREGFVGRILEALKKSQAMGEEGGEDSYMRAAIDHELEAACTTSSFGAYKNRVAHTIVKLKKGQPAV